MTVLKEKEIELSSAFDRDNLIIEAWAKDGILIDRVKISLVELLKNLKRVQDTNVLSR